MLYLSMHLTLFSVSMYVSHQPSSRSSPPHPSHAPPPHPAPTHIQYIKVRSYFGTVYYRSPFHALRSQRCRPSFVLRIAGNISPIGCCTEIMSVHGNRRKEMQRTSTWIAERPPLPLPAKIPTMLQKTVLTKDEDRMRFQLLNKAVNALTNEE